MGKRADQWNDLPTVGRVFVVVAMVGVVALVAFAMNQSEPGDEACERFRDLAADIRDGQESTSDATVDELEAIGELMADAAGEMADASGFVLSGVETARLLPDDRDEVLAPVVRRIGEVCP